MTKQSNELQKKTLTEFYELYNYPTLKEVSNTTGIQLTRLFRLNNGSKMKLDEYEIFRNLIKQKEGQQSELSELIAQFERIATSGSLNQITNNLKRNIKVWELKNLTIINTGESNE